MQNEWIANVVRILPMVLLSISAGCFYDPWESRDYTSDSYVRGGLAWRNAKYHVAGVAFSVWLKPTRVKGEVSSPYILNVNACCLNECKGAVTLDSVVVKDLAENRILFKNEERRNFTFSKARYVSSDGSAVILECKESLQEYPLPDILDPRDGKKLVVELHVSCFRHGSDDVLGNAVRDTIRIIFVPRVRSGLFQVVPA